MPGAQTPLHHDRRRRGLTLIEVMVSTVILAIVAAALTSGYMQNIRMGDALSRRTQVTNCALSIVEQIRQSGFTEVRDKQCLPPTPEKFKVKVLDPTQLTTKPTGYNDLLIAVNKRGGTVLSTGWTTLNFPTDSATAPKIPVRFWVEINRDRDAVTNIHEVITIALIYQWQNANAPANKWQSGNLRLVIPKIDVHASDT